MKVKNTAALLAFFLGGFGIHKFYLGKGGGVLRIILVCSIIGAPVSAIWALVDFVKLLTMDDAEFNSIYNSSAEGASVQSAATSTGWKIVIGVAIGVVLLFAGCGILCAVAINDAVEDIESGTMPRIGSLDNAVKDNVGMMGPRPSDGEIRRACGALRSAGWDYYSIGMGTDSRSLMIAASITTFSSGSELVNYCDSK